MYPTLKRKKTSRRRSPSYPQTYTPSSGGGGDHSEQERHAPKKAVAAISREGAEVMLMRVSSELGLPRESCMEYAKTLTEAGYTTVAVLQAATFEDIKGAGIPTPHARALVARLSLSQDDKQGSDKDDKYATWPHFPSDSADMPSARTTPK